MADRTPDRDTVLGKAAALLFSFSADDTHLTLVELTQRTGLAKSTVHRLAADLVALRLLDRDEAGYRLGGQLFELGMRASVERGLLEVATPFLEDVYERTHETVHLGVLEGTEVVYVAKIGGHRQASTPSRIGGRMPLHCTGLGKAFLAWSPRTLLDEVVAQGLERRTPRTITGAGLLRRQLDQVVEQGVAYEHEESAPGVGCAASPILGADGRAVAAISISGWTGRLDLRRIGPAVKTAALALGRELAVGAPR